MDKAYKEIDGVTHVAVLYSPGYGAGWFTWNKKHKELLYNPTIVELVENKEHDKILSYVTSMYGGDVYVGGADQLVVKWLPEGTLFTVKEYDGNEYIETIKDIKWEVT